MMFFKEPTLDEILSEDAIILLMERDGVRADDVRLLMEDLRLHYSDVRKSVSGFPPEHRDKTIV